MNIIKNTLTLILGKKVPKTALSFCTHGGFAWFVNGNGKMMSRPLSKVQIEKLREAKLLGSLGWSLN